MVLSRHNRTRSSVQRSAVHILPALILLTSLQSIIAESRETETYDIFMPYAPPDIPEVFLCTSAKLDFDSTFYIVGFEPMAMKNAHQIILYGCAKPDNLDLVYTCGETTPIDDTFDDNNYCISGTHSQIFFSWSQQANSYMLPDGVGFKIGKNTGIEYIVLQVHYERQLASGGQTGLRIHFTQEVMHRHAGMMLLGTGGYISPYSVDHMEVACPIKEWKIIYPFAFRTHTHSLGKVVTGYSVMTDADDNDIWTLLGKWDRTMTQSFYPVLKNLSLSGPNLLAARCTMESNRDYITYIGPTEDDEKCYFFLMYYMKDPRPLKRRTCYSEGPPTSYWFSSEFNLKNIPKP